MRHSRGLKYRLILPSSLSLVLLMTGCAYKSRPDSVETDLYKRPEFAEESFIKLENQSSFRFRHQFERKGDPLNVAGDFEGAYVFSDRKAVRGYLTVGGVKERLDFVASRDNEYHLNAQTREWEEKPASQEACPLAQLKKTVGLGNFEYLAREAVGGKPASVFSFEPNLAFLDPSMKKKLHGKTWVLEKSGLPVKVTAQSEDKSISWDMTLFGFNSPVTIEIPITRKFEATFAVGGNPDLGLSRGASILSERLSLIDVSNVRLKSRTKERLLFGFESENGREEMINLISEPGSLSVRLAVWPDRPVSALSDEEVRERYGPDAVLTHESGNVANALVLLDEMVSDSDVAGAALKYDQFSRPVVELDIEPEAANRVEVKTGEHVGKPLAFVVDGVVLHAPVVRKAVTGTRLIIGGFTSVKRAKAVSVLLDTEPSPIRTRLVSIHEASR